MSEENSNVPSAPPKHLWMSIVRRAVSGFVFEAHKNEYFLTDKYLERLCEVERMANVRYGKSLLYTFVLCLVGLAAAGGSLGELQVRGFLVAEVPFISEFCVLLIGYFLSIQVVVLLDLFTIGMMRRELFISAIVTEAPNMRMVHWMGHNAWIDAVLPKFARLQSGISHTAFAYFALIWTLSLPLFPLLIAGSVQWICFLSIAELNSGRFSLVLGSAGLFLTVGSFVVFVLTMFVPFRFKFEQIPSEAADVFQQSGSTER